jgi:hypothetical protein
VGTVGGTVGAAAAKVGAGCAPTEVSAMELESRAFAGGSIQ